MKQISSDVLAVILTLISMEGICDNFWNSSVSWNTTEPHLSSCFQKTVLVWTPCAFLWVFAPLETQYILKSKNRNIPWSWINISKFIFSAALLILQLILLFYNIHLGNSVKEVADFLAPVLLFITFLLQSAFVLMHKKRGIQTSGCLFLFWFLLLLCGLPGYISHFRYVDEGTEDADDMEFILYMIYYPLVILMFLVNCFADKKPTYMFHKRGSKPCPEDSVSFLSYITFQWMDRLIWSGYRNPLAQDDLWSLKYECSSRKVIKDWERNWAKTLHKTSKKGTSKTSPVYSKESKELQLLGKSSKNSHYVSILPTMMRTFGWEFFFGACIKLCSDLLQFVAPQVLSLLITFTEDEDEYTWRGYFYAVLLFVVIQAQSIFLGQYFRKLFLVGLKLRTAIISTVYRKALRISNAAKKDSTVGEIVNLMSVDAQRFMDLMPYLNMLWSAPLQIFLALFFLWRILGVAVLAGFLIMIVLIPLNGFLANKVKTLQIKQMKEKDNRVKLMSEILNGIKVLKLYAWEPSFQDQVIGIRKKEVQVLRSAAYINAGTSFIWTSTPFMVSLASFGVFVALSDTPLDSKTAFVSISLFNLLRFPVMMLPNLITNMVQAQVSLKRMNKFMNAEELDPNSVIKEDSSIPHGHPITITNGSFAWDREDEKPTLNNIDLHLKEGSLVAVVGSVGAGKSSLCSAILGEMDKLRGTVCTRGSVSYVPQQAWIQNETVECNITFGSKAEDSFYHRIIRACALSDDLQILPAGDQTEIGEKGINLSGGQKQRVSLARAVYANSDIYLMDDPLSAVDSHVGKHIFEHVIGPQGLLKKKTRLLVTHSLVYLPIMDNIIVLKNGEITEIGTYKELIEKKGEFQEFLLQYLSQEEDTEDIEELDNIMTDLEVSLGRQTMERQISRKRQESECSHDGGVGNGSIRSKRKRRPSEISERSLSQLKETSKAKDEIVGKKIIEAESSETGRVSVSVYSYYIKAIGILAAVSTILLYTASQICAVLANIVLSYWSEDDDADKDDVRNKYLGSYGLLGLGQATFVLFAVIVFARGAISGGRWLHNSMLKNIIRLPLTFFDITPTGRIVNRFSKDIDSVDLTLPMTLRNWLNFLITVLATLGVIVYTTPMFIVVIIPVMIIYYIVQLIYVTTSRQLKRIESVSRSPIYSHFGETVQGAATIRAFNKIDEFILHSEKKVDYNQTSYFPSVIANRWLAIRLEFLGNVLTFFAALLAVMSKDEITAGDVGLSITYALSVTQTLNWLVRMTSDVETNIVAVERIKEYSESTQEAAWEIPQNKPHKNWPENGLVKFSKYATRYREGLDLVVKGVDCEFKPMEKIGIVGRTGAGKSSLTLALFRIIEPADGSILIDGVDISKIGLHDLRGKLTIIPQDPVLFSGTLRINLDPFNRYSDDEIWMAIQHAHLKEFTSSLTARLQHPITEGGENLSVGQRQLVCLARALLRKTKVLILDEATAAVDLETDDLIQQTIRREFADCTVITIAHRLNTIMDSSKILVLDRGQIQEFEPPDTLLKNKDSLFYAMAKDAGLVN